jgi:hypothetical protein
MGRLKCDYITRLTTLTSYYFKWLSQYKLYESKKQKVLKNLDNLEKIIIFTNIRASFPMTFVFIFLLLDVITGGSSSFTLFGLLSTLVSLK